MGSGVEGNRLVQRRDDPPSGVEETALRLLYIGVGGSGLVDGEGDDFAVAHLFDACVEGRVRALLLIPGQRAPIPATFEAVVDGGVTLEPARDVGVGVGATVGVGFNIGGRWAQCVTRVRRTVPLTVGLPSFVVSEARKHPRVPVHEDSHLAARVWRSQDSWEPQVLDLSMGGIGLRFPEPAPKFPKGALVRLELVYRVQHVAAVAMVVRSKGPVVGFQIAPFGGLDRAGQASLASMIAVLQLEAKWIATERGAPPRQHRN